MSFLEHREEILGWMTVTTSWGVAGDIGPAIT